MIPSLEGWPTKAKEAPSPHEVRLAPLDTNPVFHSLRGKALGNLGLPLSTVTYIQYEISFFIKIYNMKSVFLITIHVKIFYIQIWFKYEAPLLCFRIKTMINKNHFLNFFFPKTIIEKKCQKGIELHVIHTWCHMQSEVL